MEIKHNYSLGKIIVMLTDLDNYSIFKKIYCILDHIFL